MASNTKQAVKEAERKRRVYYNNYQYLFNTLFHNSVNIKNLPKDLPKRYLLGILLNYGSIAYDKQTGLFLPYTEAGINVYGLPYQYHIIGFDGFYRTRMANEVVILRANDLSYAVSKFIDQQVEKLVEYDMSISQNLEAIKTMSIIKVGNKCQLLSMANIESARRIGAMIAYTDNTINYNDSLAVASTGAQYIVDKLLENRRIVLNETLSAIGISNSNTDKRERVQSTEVMASLGFAKNCIKTLVETFNYDAEIGGLDIRFEENTELQIYFEEENINGKADTV